jgi:hypothetical protein
MDHKLKTLLIQLPHLSYIDRNVPLAAGYLKASAYECGLLEKVDIEILDPIISSHNGCQRLIDAIIYRNPDILGFTIYLWNVERTLYVIGKIKAILPHVKVIVGGPEVTKYSNYILSNSNIDIFVIGEGEITFVEILNHFLSEIPQIDEILGICYLKNNKIVFNKTREKINDLELIPSPYLLGFIDPSKYKEMPLFTMRGCTLGCSYCSWAARGKLRAHSIERLKKELLLAKKISEQTGENIIIYIYDSAFNASPVFFEFCKVIKEINKDKSLKFQGFVLADLIDETQAKLLKDCNFGGVELGLQSVNPDTLTNINRFMDMNRFLNGVRCLEKESIPITIDIILGLPGDSPTSFEKTLKFISEIGLESLDNRVAMFTLSLGHGSRLSRQIDKFGAKTQPYPPFYVLSTDSFPNDELKTAIIRNKGFSADLDRLLNLNYPSIICSPSQHYFNDVASLKDIDYPVRSIVLNINIETSTELSNKIDLLAEVICQNVASRLSILIQGEIENIVKSKGLIRALITQISNKNPYITWDIFLEPEGCNVPQAFVKEIASFIKRPITFLDHRDDLFPTDMPDLRRKDINIFSILPSENDKESKICVNSLSFIRDPKNVDEMNISIQKSKINQPEGSGCLIEYQTGLDINSIKRSMALLYEKKELKKIEGIFFKDWVIQRLWEQEFLKITPERIYPYYELIINTQLNFSKKLFNENQLLLDAITRWKLLKSQYCDLSLNIEDIIYDKIMPRLNVKEFI